MTNPYWNFKKPNPKYGYVNNPFQADEAEHTGKHHPCGYWPVGADPLNQPEVRYILWSCGRDLHNCLGRDASDWNIFLPMDNTEHFYKVSLANSQGLYIKSDKTLWGLGNNNQGELGTGDIIGLDVMTQIGLDNNWEAISSTGGVHSLAIKENGSLWACGNNDYGQLGLNDTVERLTFQQVGAEFDWKSVHGDTYSSYAIKENGDLYSWGSGVSGNLGHGNTQDYHIPTQVTTNGSGFDSITGGYLAAIGLKSGKIWSCGYNLYGQLCLDHTTATNVFVERAAGETWDSVHCGRFHSMLIKNDGTLHGVGHNSYGNLGLDHQNNISIVTQVGIDTDWAMAQANGTYAFSMALKNDGSLYSCGSNRFGQLGLGSQLTQGPIVFTEVGGTWGTVICGDSHSHIGESVYEWE